MSSESEQAAGRAAPGTGIPRSESQWRHELEHLRTSNRWFLLLGVLLVLCGLVAIIFPAITSVAVVSVLGAVLLVAGIATIIGAFWAGKWSGFLIQLLVGILYLACGMVVTESPVVTVVMMTLFVAVSFIVLGLFRTVGALVMRFPQWGWALLNGVITLLCGLVIYRHWPLDSLWVIGLLVGLEMLFNGWVWIMLARSLPRGSSIEVG